MRTQKLRGELAAAKKAAEHYLGQADLAHRMEKKGRLPGSATGASAASGEAKAVVEAPRRRFVQKKVIDGSGGM